MDVQWLLCALGLFYLIKTTIQCCGKAFFYSMVLIPYLAVAVWLLAQLHQRQVLALIIEDFTMDARRAHMWQLLKNVTYEWTERWLT